MDLGSLADAIGEIEAETEIYEAGIEEAYYVIYEAENADGDTEEKTVIMFHVKDDGWKAAVAPTESEKLEREDEERGKQLDNIVRAINTAIVEMDDWRVFRSGGGVVLQSVYLYWLLGCLFDACLGVLSFPHGQDGQAHSMPNHHISECPVDSLPFQ